MDIFDLKDKLIGSQKVFTLRLLKASTDIEGSDVSFSIPDPQKIIMNFNEDKDLKEWVIREKFEFFKIFNKNDELIIYGPIKLKYQ